MKNAMYVLCFSVLSSISLSTHSRPTVNNLITPSAITNQVKLLCKQNHSLNPNILKHAIKAYYKADKNRLIKNKVLTVIDYTKSSDEKRLWVIDMKKNRVSFHTHVAHGQKTGLKVSRRFSNKSQSFQSSLGVFITGHSYIGANVGYALQINGIEKGFNDMAAKRGVIMHGATYVDSHFIKTHGRAGRSYGCPALPTKLTKPIIDTIKNGSVIFAYYPDNSWIKNSRYM